MPVWLIGFLIGMGLYGGVRQVLVHHQHKAPAPVLVQLDQKAAQQFVDCLSAAQIAAGSPATLDCMEVYTNGAKSN